MSEIEFELSDDIIKERLRINDANTINGIYTICNNLYKEEIERTKAIEDKSKSLLSSIGVMLGLLFTVGGFLLEKIKNVSIPVIGSPKIYLSILYLILGFLLVISGILSFKSLVVRKTWKTISEKDIFREDVIDKEYTHYARYMTTHIWKIYKNNFDVNNNKTKDLFYAQILFIITLIGFSIMIVIIGAYVYYV